MKLDIVEATFHDAEPIIALVQQLRQELDEYAGQGDLSIDDVEEYLSFPGNTAFIAEDGGKPIGLLTLSIRPNLFHGGPSALIEELLVLPAYRGKNIGGSLVRRAIEHALDADCAEIGASTIEAAEFYRGLGLTDESLLLEKHF